MDKLKLVIPTAEYKKSFIEAIQEFQLEGRNLEINILDLGNNFEKYLTKLADEEKGIGMKEGYVPATTLWLVEGGEFIGHVSIRHCLTENLQQVGGHIGYSIRPTKRRMGYGTKTLEFALLEAKKFGIHNVLITCDDDNVGSAKIIEKNGGVLENKVEGEYESEAKKLKRRYWIVNK